MKTILFGVLLILAVGCTMTTTRPGGISQFVEERDGRRSVWGVDVTLGSLSFTPGIRTDQIQITSGKQGHDLKDMLVWSVSPDRKCLSIRFKPGMGDFGSGNRVAVCVSRSAIVGYSGVNNGFEWSIPTDVQ